MGGGGCRVANGKLFLRFRLGGGQGQENGKIGSTFPFLGVGAGMSNRKGKDELQRSVICGEFQENRVSTFRFSDLVLFSISFRGRPGAPGSIQGPRRINLEAAGVSKGHVVLKSLFKKPKKS